MNAATETPDKWRARVSAAVASVSITCGAAAMPVPAAEMPRYAHIFVIVAENKSYDQIFGPHTLAPNINRLALQYGQATQFFAEVHPSEGNYVAMLAGDTFGIHDDDAFYCKRGMSDHWCAKSAKPDYANHTLVARSLVDQLEAKGLDWKAYEESLPAPGSLAVRWPTHELPVHGVPPELYAAKHNGFLNFERVQKDPQRAAKIVDFEQLNRDLAAGRLPNYAHIVPNQCNDMHGRDDGPDVPEDCRKSNPAGLIARGDRVIFDVVQRIISSSVWAADGNTAIVLTFDENDKDSRQGADQGCCGYDPASSANFGGGHIPTVVITNHGPHHVTDPTPYNHYSLLRTTEAAFGIDEFLAHAAEEHSGVVSMTPLFAVVH